MQRLVRDEDLNHLDADLGGHDRMALRCRRGARGRRGWFDERRQAIDAMHALHALLGLEFRFLGLGLGLGLEF